MPQGLVKPVRGILHSGQPVVHEMEILTATQCFPGRLVQTDTNEWSCKVQTSGGTNTLGVLDVEAGNRRTVLGDLGLYHAGDQARVLTGPIIVLLTYDTMPAACAIGDTLIPANTGFVQKGTTAGAVIGVALQAATISTNMEILVLLEI